MTDVPAITAPVWSDAESAPRPADRYSWSRTFIAFAPEYGKQPFPCKQREGKFYDLDVVHNDADWGEVDNIQGLIWTDMPTPSN